MRNKIRLGLMAIFIVLMISSCDSIKLPGFLANLLQDQEPAQNEAPAILTPVAQETVPFFWPTRQLQETPLALPTQPTIEQPTQPAIEQPTLLPTQTPIPTQIVSPQLGSTKMQDGMWFTYPEQLWFGTGDAVFPNLQHKTIPECQIYLNNGHGMADMFVPTASQVTIEGQAFTMTEWRYTGTNEIVLKAYSWDDSYLFTIENPEANVLNAQCLNDAEDVLRYSVMRGFEKAVDAPPQTGTVTETTQEPEKPQATIPIIVYSKDNDIWVYSPETKGSTRLTYEGGNKNASEWSSFRNPKLSPDKSYVAYEEFYYNEVYVHHIKSDKRWYMRDYLPETETFDHLMGWDQQGRLYFSRKHGSCGSSGNPTVDVLRFDVNKERIERLDALPVSGNTDGAFAQGFDVSPSGRYFSYYETQCNPAFPGVAMLYDSQTGQFLNQVVSGSNSLSHNENYLAYPHGYKFEELMNVYVIVKDIHSDDFWELDNFEQTRTLWDNPHWSFDDRYLVISQNSITNPVINDYTPDIWWNLSKTALAMIDMQDPTFKPVYLTEVTPTEDDWEFVKWSPTDYRILIIQRQLHIGDSGNNIEWLWVFNPFTREAVDIAKGDSVQGADW